MRKVIFALSLATLTLTSAACGCLGFLLVHRPGGFSWREGKARRRGPVEVRASQTVARTGALGECVQTDALDSHSLP